MSIAAAIFLVVVGAILKFAVSDSIDGVDLETIGLILMIAGVVGLLLGLFLYSQDRRRGDVVVQREVRRDDVPPPR